MYSLRDSIIKPDDLITRLQELGQKAVAITDHGSSLGGVSIYKALKAAGIKYIHGVEFYCCDDVSVRDKDSRYYHLVALCKNEQGRKNMNRLISLSEHPDRFYYKPRIDFDLLTQYSEGLIIMSACMAGEVCKRLLEGDKESAIAVAQKYKDQFGEDYYLEIQSHRDPVQIELNQQVAEISEKLQIPCVVTCDAHYVREEDKKYQNKYAFNGTFREDDEAYIDCFIQSADEARERLWYLPSEFVERVIAQTHLIADRCNLEIPLAAPIMPTVDTPENFSTNKEWLESLCAEGFRTKLNIDLATNGLYDSGRMLIRELYDDDGNRCGEEAYQLTRDQIQTYIERYQYELNALEKMGFLDYILLVYSYANVGKRRGIARGSGGGSLINYLTNITNIDPIEHGLYFERFIDVGALDQLASGEITAKELKIPDIDLDFSGESCNDVLHFLHDKYGADRVASIGKFGTNKTKGSIRDLCKVLDIPLDVADTIAKSFGDYEIEEIDMMLSGELEVIAGAKDAMKNVQKYPELFDYVRKLNNLPKSFGLHACGKIISTRDLDDFLPSCYDSEGIRYLQGDMHDVEDMGLVKIDVLGLRTLDQEYDTLEQSHETNEFLDPKQSYNNPKVLDVFRNGDTVGIFQFSSPGMRNTLKKMNVSGIDDISAANALFRPGAMAYIDSFCKRKHGQEEIKYLHPDLQPILENTYGIIVFQEQLIEIGRMAGLHNPDLLRKATGKKNPALLAQIKPELEEKLLQRGWSPEQFETLWADMLEFARYSFNKCVAWSTRVRVLDEDNSVRCLTVEELWKAGMEYGYAFSMFPDGKVRRNKIVDIQPQGVRTVWKVRTVSGAQLSCTSNHKFPTPNGKKALEDMSCGDPLFVVDDSKGIMVDAITYIRYAGKQMTYDIEMAAPAHNFISESGLVTSNSHSSAYAILAYMTAKQKAYYPAEFFAGLCNSYIGQSAFVNDDADEIIGDAYRHGVCIAPFSFRSDHRKCHIVNRQMIYAIPLIKGCNQLVADVLYHHNDTTEKHFWRLAKTLTEEGVDKTQLKTLVLLGFFDEYGARKTLLRVLDATNLFKAGDRKTIPKLKVDGVEYLQDIVQRYGVGQNDKGEPLKTYRLTDTYAILDECEDALRSMEVEDFDFKNKIATQMQYLGFVSLQTNQESDRAKLFVRGVYPICRKSDGAQFGYSILTRSVGSGIESRFTVFNRVFDKEPIQTGDIIKCLGYSRQGKYFTMDRYEHIFA